MNPLSIHPAVLGIVAVAGLGLGFTGGYTFAWSRQEAVIQTMRTDEAKRQTAAVEATLAQERARAAISAAADTAAVEVQEKIRTVYRTITKKVTVYVTAKSDAACTLPRGFVSVHNAAAEGRPLPDPPSDVDAPSGVALSAASTVVAENYGACRADQERLRGLQDWVRKQSIAP